MEPWFQTARRTHVHHVGHGVLQGTPEESVQYFVDAAKATKLPLA